MDQVVVLVQAIWALAAFFQPADGALTRDCVKMHTEAQSDRWTSYYSLRKFVTAKIEPMPTQVTLDHMELISAVMTCRHPGQSEDCLDALPPPSPSSSAKIVSSWLLLLAGRSTCTSCIPI